MTSLATQSLTEPKNRTRALVVLGLLVVLIAALHVAARFGLGGPELLSNNDLGVWLEDPVIVIATFARWVSLFLAYYLAVIIGAVVLFGQEWTEGRWSLIAPSSVTGLVALLLGVSAIAVPIATRATPAPPQQLILQEMETLTLTQVEAPQVHAPIAEHSSLEAPADHSLWTVSRGESFWSIAEEHLGDELARTNLTDDEVADYWRVLIAANTDRLVDQENPDLIFPGQELLLPPVPRLGG